MKVYVCTDFTGVWPVGVSAVIVAESASEAEQILNEALKARGLKGDAEVHEGSALELSKPNVRILQDGDY